MVTPCLFVCADSRFQVLSGNVTLGQRAELLEYAARLGEQATIGVLAGRQTAIVEAGSQALINFNYFFLQALGLLPAGDLTVTITRQLLDSESGAPVPEREEVLSPSQGRTSVSVGGEGQQHFVSISNTMLSDSGVYTIEVCSQSGTVCQEASATLFVLDCKLKFPNHGPNCSYVHSLSSGSFCRDVHQHSQQPGEHSDCGLLFRQWHHLQS